MLSSAKTKISKQNKYTRNIKTPHQKIYSLDSIGSWEYYSGYEFANLTQDKNERDVSLSFDIMRHVDGSVVV